MESAVPVGWFVAVSMVLDCYDLAKSVVVTLITSAAGPEWLASTSQASSNRCVGALLQWASHYFLGFELLV